MEYALKAGGAVNLCGFMERWTDARERRDINDGVPAERLPNARPDEHGAEGTLFSKQIIRISACERQCNGTV